MKKLILLLILLLPVVSWASSAGMLPVGGVTVVAAAGGGPTQKITDTFTGSDTTALHSYSASWTDDIAGLQIISNAVGPATANADAISHSTTSIGSADQYAKFSIGYTSLDSDSGIAIIFRVTNASSPAYILYFWQSGPGDAWKINWFHVDKLTATPTFTEIGSVSTISGAINSGDTMGLTIAGTGASTHIRIWKNTTANAPDSATSWDGNSSPAVDLITPGANNVDSGNYIGIHGFLSSIKSLGQIKMDTLFGGSL